jgi:hypothetical protein
VVSEAVEERGRHLGVAEDARPFAEAQVGGDDVSREGPDLTLVGLCRPSFGPAKRTVLTKEHARHV